MVLGADETALKLAGWLPMDTGPLDGYIMLIMSLMMMYLFSYIFHESLRVFVFYLMNACVFTPPAIGFLLNISSVQPIANVFILLATVTALWRGIAERLEISFGRPVLWMGKPLLARKAISAPAG